LYSFSFVLCNFRQKIVWSVLSPAYGLSSNGAATGKTTS